MGKITLAEFAAQEEEGETFSVETSRGDTLELTLRSPSREAADRVQALVVEAFKDREAGEQEIAFGIRKAEYLALEVCAEGVTDENAVRVLSEGGDRLANACLQLCGLVPFRPDRDGDAPPREKKSPSATS